MGINNLSSFIIEYGLKKPYKLSDTYVVVDGFNVCYVLYAQFSEENPNDFLFGGNYTEYQKLFEKFLQNLRQCNITPIFVFDGEANPNLNNTQFRRFKKTFNEMKKLSDNPPILPLRRQMKRNVKPRLLKKLFKSVAHMMKVDCFTTKSDADLEMAKLAIQLDCPLVTYDSDFFVMNIKRGVIDSMKWQNPLPLNQSKYYIECEVYKVDDLLKFKNPLDFQSKQIEMKAEMLPIFGTLLGNDAINGQIFYDLFNEIDGQTKCYSLITDQLSGSDKKCHKKWRQMDQLICWLTFRFPDANQAILHIELYCTRSPNPRALQKFRDSLKSYDTNGKSYLKELLDNKLMAKTGDMCDIKTNLNECEDPKCFQMNSLMDSLIETKVFFSKPQIEDFSLESTFDSSIRLKGFHLGLLRTNRKDETPVRLTRRKGVSYEEILIHIETHINGNKQLPIKSEIKNLSQIERKGLLFDILEFKEKWITDFEQGLGSIGIQSEDIDIWKYFIILIKYWTSNSKIKNFKAELMEAFILKIIYFRHNSLIRNDFNGMTSVEYCSGQQFKPFVIHYYCEIQSLYSGIDKLVSILDDPIVGHTLHHYFNGILLYNLFYQIITNPINKDPFKDDKLNTIYKIIVESIVKTIDH